MPQVKPSDAEDAGQVFCSLMGNAVEPWRDVIVSTALKMADLDV